MDSNFVQEMVPDFVCWFGEEGFNNNVIHIDISI